MTIGAPKTAVTALTESSTGEKSVRAMRSHPQQKTAPVSRHAHLDDSIAASKGRQQAAFTKERKKVADQAAELAAYEEKVHHLADQMIAIDLDDGVKVNYAKFQDVLAKIK